MRVRYISGLSGGTIRQGSAPNFHSNFDPAVIWFPKSTARSQGLSLFGSQLAHSPMPNSEVAQSVIGRQPSINRLASDQD